MGGLDQIIGILITFLVVRNYGNRMESGFVPLGLVCAYCLKQWEFNGFHDLLAEVGIPLYVLLQLMNDGKFDAKMTY